MPGLQQVILLSVLALIINLPLGWWRASVHKFSLAWFLAIHLSVPVIYLLRTWTGIGINAIPVLVFFAIAGQLIGGKLYVTD